jgi:signal transduction histidine kinase
VPTRRIPPARRRDPKRVDPHVGTRVEAFVRDADLGRVAAILAEGRDDVLRRWLEAARLQPFHARQPDRAVADHIPHLFDALVAFLQRAAPWTVDPEAPLDDRAVHAAAQEHARARFVQGLSPPEVLTEFRLLRQEIGRALRDRLRGAAAADVVGAELLVHDALDGATTLALAALDAQEAERRFLAVEVVRLGAEKDRLLEAARFLAAAGALLAGSLDLDGTLASVARLCVPRLGRWCAVYLVDEQGAVRRLVGAHADPAKEELMGELARGYPLSPDPSHPVRRALATGRTVVAGVVDGGAVDRYATDAEHARILRELATTSAVVVPLVARDQRLGALSLGPADAVDSSLAEELAARAALAIDNAWLYRRAQEALRVRDEVLATASHDLKTPLTTIKTQAQMLQRRAGALPPPAGERVAAGLATITAATARMVAMINELLDVAHLRMGQALALERHPTDLVALARRTTAEAQQTTDRHTVRVEAAVPELVGDWDAFRLERVLGNLLSNAVKFSPEGGEVVVRVARADGAGGPWAELTVQDRGVGIPAADLPRLFARFHRGANVVGKIRGEGIGLAGAKQIVEQHGGAIAVESAEGSGSTFTVRVPLAS